MKKISFPHLLIGCAFLGTSLSCSSGDNSDPYFAVVVEKNSQETMPYETSLLDQSVPKIELVSAGTTGEIKQNVSSETFREAVSSKPKVVAAATIENTAAQKTESQKTPSRELSVEPKSSAPGKAILVLDASGSMWGQVGDRTKIEIAKEALSSTVTKWSSDSELGLIAYGHNRKGDCSDIEVLINPAKVDASKFIAVADAIKPKGKTPLTAAVKQAAEQLRYEEGKATVILISDGKETCDLDPCRVGAELEESGIDFTAHVISFDVPEEDTLGMQCLADKTGGMFIQAKNADELQDALDSARSVATDTSELKLDAATIFVSNPVSAGSSFKAEWTGPENRGDFLGIVDPDKKQKGLGRTSLIVNDFASPVNLTAPEKPGTYNINYVTRDHNILGTTELEVIAVTASITLPAQVIAGSRFDVEFTGPKNKYDALALRNPDGTLISSVSTLFGKDANSAALTAPDAAGTYVVRYITKNKKVLASETLNVIAAAASLRIEQTEIIAGNQIAVHWTGPGNDHDEIMVYQVNGEEYKSGKRGTKTYKSFADKNNQSPTTLEVPETPGDYLVVYRTAKNEKKLAEIPITISPATAWIRITSTAVTAGKFFELEWSGPENRSDRLKITSLDGKQSYHGGMASKAERKKVLKGRPSKLIAPKESGTYLVKLLSGEKRELARTTLVVK